MFYNLILILVLVEIKISFLINFDKKVMKRYVEKLWTYEIFD